MNRIMYIFDLLFIFSLFRGEYGAIAPFPEDATVYVALLISSQNKRRKMPRYFLSNYVVYIPSLMPHLWPRIFRLVLFPNVEC